MTKKGINIQQQELNKYQQLKDVSFLEDAKIAEEWNW